MHTVLHYRALKTKHPTECHYDNLLWYARLCYHTNYKLYQVQIKDKEIFNNLLDQKALCFLLSSSMRLCCYMSADSVLGVVPPPVSWCLQYGGFGHELARSFPPLQSSREDEPYATGSSFLTPRPFQTCVSLALLSLTAVSSSAEIEQRQCLSVKTQ